MNQWLNLYAPLVGRILIGGYFLWSGIEKTLNFPAFVDFYINAHLPQPLYFALFILSLETLCGLALIIDIKTRAVSLVLALYVLLSSGFFFSTLGTTGVQTFFQNMAVVGALLLLAAFGANKWNAKWRN